MTVKELIAALEQFDPETLVVTNGHSDSDSFENIDDVTPMSVKGRSSWAGAYEACAADEVEAIPAVHIR